MKKEKNRSINENAKMRVIKLESLIMIIEKHGERERERK